MIASSRSLAHRSTAGYSDERPWGVMPYPAMHGRRLGGAKDEFGAIVDMLGSGAKSGLSDILADAGRKVLASPEGKKLEAAVTWRVVVPVALLAFGLGWFASKARSRRTAA